MREWTLSLEATCMWFADKLMQKFLKGVIYLLVAFFTGGEGGILNHPRKLPTIAVGFV